MQAQQQDAGRKEDQLRPHPEGVFGITGTCGKLQQQ